MRVVTSAMMREMDRRTVEGCGVPGILLMERAGAGAAQVAFEMLGPGSRRVVVLCGKGNNGGDGFVIARRLRAAGHTVATLLAADPGEVRGDAALALASLRESGGEVACPSPTDLPTLLADVDLVVDALLGTGLSGPVSEPTASWIRAVNDAERPVLAIDIPSGLCADRGAVLGVAVRASVTVTFALPKLGLLQYPGPPHAGRLVAIDIGIPGDLVPDSAPELLESDAVAGLLPARRPDAHKGDSGRVLLVAGSPGLTGAACLAARSASRAGAGLVTVAAPSGVCPSIEARLLEAMTHPLRICPETLSPEAVGELRERLSLADAVAIGPGLGRAEGVTDAVRALLSEAQVPTVVDADGLLALPGWTRDGRGDLVLTPHPGEMAALLGTSVAEVQADREAATREAADRFGAVVVLKGARSLIAAPDGRLAINPTGHEGMASGGMGDVLTGLIAGLLAQSMGTYEAACAGVFLHGWAAELAARRVGGRVGIVAGDVLDELPRARATVVSGGGPASLVEPRPMPDVEGPASAPAAG